MQYLPYADLIYFYDANKQLDFTGYPDVLREDFEWVNQVQDDIEVCLIMVSIFQPPLFEVLSS